MSPSGTLTVIHDFHKNSENGISPEAGLFEATDGEFYGEAGGKGFTHGLLFRITSKGEYTDLFSFDGASGANPSVSLFQHTNGTLYGDTADGGAQSMGVFYSLDMGLGPFVRFVNSLSSGKVGKTIQILGQGFTGTSAVSFNGTAASFLVKSDTFLTAIVPPGAISGFVTVTTPSGTLTSNEQFRVRP